jgi:hypothetical protein
MTETSNSFKGYSKEYILGQMLYENEIGSHTYHMCECGRKGCRSIRCALCWQEELNKLLKEKQKHD